MFITKKTIKNSNESYFSDLRCLYCGEFIPIYRNKGYVDKRAWFCSTICSKKISYKITYKKLNLLKAKFLKDEIPLKAYDWLLEIEKNK